MVSIIYIYFQVKKDKYHCQKIQPLFLFHKYYIVCYCCGTIINYKIGKEYTMKKISKFSYSF